MLEFRVQLDKKLIQRTVISKGSVRIGRASDNDLVLSNSHVSRLHVIIEREGEKFRLQDQSTNGILVDGVRVSEPIILPLRCRLEIYPFEIECFRQHDDTTMPIQKETGSKPEPTDLRPQTSSKNESLSLHYGSIVGESPVMHHVYRLIEDVASNPVTVLIRGDHGTGKELVALAIHETSPRRSKPFIAVNCAAIPIDLIESELFGYEKGAFTGAQGTKKGKIEEANGGTLFLDEIGEMSLPAQAKLLRFLQGKTITRLGNSKETKVDVRVVAATNKALGQAVREEAFRADLYYRIKVVQITLPQLRERPEDIPLLALHFLDKLQGELEFTSKPVLTPEAMNRLKSARFPGNIRQLENVLYSAVIRSRAPYVIEEGTLLAESPTWTGLEDEETEPPIDTITKQLLLQVLRNNQWDTSKAADVLKVSRGTIYYKLKKYGIDLKDPSRGGLRL